MYVSVSEAAIMVGVSASTLRRWGRDERCNECFRTEGGHRRFNVARLRELLGFKTRSKNEDAKSTVAYARVSSHDQKEDLTRQEQRLIKYCKMQKYKKVELISDLGSGLNYKKRGLLKLIKLILTGQVDKIVLTHKDRLLRFGSEIIFSICRYFGIEVEVIEEVKAKSDEESLAMDVLEIITVFAARLYGKRAHQKKITCHN
jgi:putative resolvase